MRRTAALSAAVLVLLFASFPQAQGTPPASPLILLTRAGRRPVPTTIVGGPEMIALDDVGSLFQAAVREDPLAGGVTVTYHGRTIAASAGQSAVSVAGRLVSLPAPVLHSGRRWLVPIEFLPRALGLIYDQRIDLRRNDRLLVVGDLRVPRVTAHIDVPGPPTHVTIEVSPAATVGATAQGGRITLRIDADALELALPPGGGLVEGFRAGDQPNTVVVALAPGAGTPRIATTAATNLTRVTIDVASTVAPGQTAAPAQPPPAPAPAQVPAPGPPPRPAIATIAIDPGHGGEDVGARGPGGLQEKAVTLDVAQRLKNLIETRLGLRVVMTRTDDRAVGLDERTAIANNSKADLLLSLHANAALTPSITGAEVYYLKATADIEQARREAESDAVTLPILGGGTRVVDMIRWDMAQARHLDQSQAFATVLSQELDAQVPASPRPLQQALLRVLEGADMPAAEVELLYLTNPDQAKQAASDDFKNTLAQALFDAIVKFRMMPEAAAR